MAGERDDGYRVPTSAVRLFGRARHAQQVPRTMISIDCSATTPIVFMCCKLAHDTAKLIESSHATGIFKIEAQVDN